MANDKIGGARQLVQDFLAPAVGRLEERIAGVSDECVRLAREIERNRGEIKELWEATRDNSTKVARAEGRLESVKSEVIATVKLDLVKYFQSSNQRELPPSSEDS
ncbi:MAG TPA: hypothetical protein VLF66_04190 [Thermoanaerobaculia bacterium]|nr:hypothetical protein [Thermoanaerobaculia bacterium]